ncbi:MAG: cell division protein FtsQ/DivIB [Actinomycetes bacterium]
MIRGSRLGRWQPVARLGRKGVGLVLLGLVVMTALAAWVLLASPVLAVRTVAVSITSDAASGALDPSTVQGAAGVRTGVPLARVSLSAVAARVQALPQVGSAVVTRSWPHTLTITVVERRPVAVLADGVGPGRTFWLVDASGLVYRRVALAPARMTVAVARGAAMAVGTQDALTRAAATVVAALPTALSAQVRQVDVTTSSPAAGGPVGGVDVRLLLVSGAVVEWGGPQSSETKAAVLAGLLHQPARVYDLSAPLAPTTVQ